MKKTQKNYRVEYSEAIKALSHNDEEFGSLRDIQAELESQVEREKKSASEYPAFYKLSDIMNSVSGNSYRTGEVDGVRVMTHEDYMRLIVAETNIPEYGKSPRKSCHVEPRPAAVYNVRECGKALAERESMISSCESVIDGDDYSVARVEYSDTTASGTVTRFFDKWFPSHTVVKQERKYRRRLASSAAGIAWVMIFTIVLALPITLSVLKSDAVSELTEKRAALVELEREEARLEAEFESSLDLREIESIAVRDYGMIKLNESTVRVLRLNEGDTIESFAERERTALVPALLSALGIRASGE